MYAALVLWSQLIPNKKFRKRKDETGEKMAHKMALGTYTTLSTSLVFSPLRSAQAARGFLSKSYSLLFIVLA
jgi:hypothetical protein